MRILYAALKYDYGKPEQGFSFEHYNFYHSLLHMGHDLLYFDYMTLMQKHGRDWMNKRLKEVAETEKPDLLFTILFTDQLDPLVIRELTEAGVPTLNWFCDDHWRFDTYSRHWASCFKWVVTTAASALPKYSDLGYHNAIKSQWACNTLLYRKMEVPFQYDVTFVGQPHGNRRQVIHALRKAGIKAHVWGGGWESGRISQEEMIRVFNQSRINLNLSNASIPVSAPAVPPRTTIRSRVSRSLDMVPFGSHLKSLGKVWRKRLVDSAAVPADTSTTEIADVHYAEQIKARNFEIPGCGGFVLTGRADNLERYYEISKEVVCFEELEDLVEKVRYYLSHEDERAAIAQAGYERTMREHTYVHRFNEIFQRMGMSASLVLDRIECGRHPGHTQEVL
jgi:spore maturation protein CgeB